MKDARLDTLQYFKIANDFIKDPEYNDLKIDAYPFLTSLEVGLLDNS